MNYEPEISYVESRPAMTVTPDYDEMTGEARESTVHYTTDKDAYLANDELIEQQQQESQSVETDDDIHYYTIEEVDQLLDERRDEPDQQLAEVSWNLELPDGVPGLDLVQILSTKYLAGQMTYEDALDEAFSHGLTEAQLLRAYSLYNAAYNKALNR